MRRRAKPSEKADEADQNDDSGKTKKVTGAMLRFRKDLTAIEDMPDYVTVTPVEGFEDEKITFTIDMGKMDDSIWYGGKYNFSFEITPKYPIDPPKVLCTTPIWHPNIDEDGNICLNILKTVTVGGAWKPQLDTSAVILGLVFLFFEPNPNDPLNQKASAQMRENLAGFKADVKKSLQGGVVNGKQYPKMI